MVLALALILQGGPMDSAVVGVGDAELNLPFFTQSRDAQEAYCKKQGYTVIEKSGQTIALSIAATETYASRAEMLLKSFGQDLGNVQSLQEMDPDLFRRFVQLADATPGLAGRRHLLFEPGAAVRLRPVVMATLKTPAGEGPVSLGPGKRKNLPVEEVLARIRGRSTSGPPRRFKEEEYAPNIMTTKQYFAPGLSEKRRVDAIRMYADFLKGKAALDELAIAKRLDESLKKAMAANVAYFGAWNGKVSASPDELGPDGRAELEITMRSQWKSFGFASEEEAMSAMKHCSLRPKVAFLGLTLEVPRGTGVSRYTVGLGQQPKP
jgi:hypothetical protein